ncbi:MAG: hypothetical protein QME05_05275 [Candidatus Margulisbacteria bacterium]|nr:hypothetical protein [Candidatus Margulisiibacteriota bacterium]
MKKAVALLTVLAFVVVLAASVYAEDTRSAAEKIASGQEYLNALDTKIIKYRKLGNNTMVAKLQAEKKSTLAKLAAWKAEMAAEGPAPVTPPPAPVIKAAPAPVSAGLFGWGLNTGYTVGYIAGNSVTLLRADMILGDGLGLGSLLGMGSDTINWKIGLGGAMGTDVNGTSAKAIPLFIDGIINIPADLLGGVQSYLGGGVNYALYGTGSTTGSYGGEVYLGIKGDIGLGGNSYLEVSWSDIRSGSGVTTPYSMKGVGVNVGTQLML